MPKVYDKIRLRTGEIGRIIEDFGDDCYLVEFSLKSGGIETAEVKKSDISTVFVETETPISSAI